MLKDNSKQNLGERAGATRWRWVPAGGGELRSWTTVTSTQLPSAKLLVDLRRAIKNVATYLYKER